MKKTYFLLLFLAVTSVAYFSCDDSTDSELLGNWSKSTPLTGDARSGAVSFTIGDSAYVGLGIDANNKYLYDFWKFVPNDGSPYGSWSQKANLEDTALKQTYGRVGAVAFATGGKGYVGTGYGYGYEGDSYTAKNYLNDFWEYNPENDTWTRVSSFPGKARKGAIAFAVNGKGYVGTGFNAKSMSDFYQFDPATGVWTDLSTLNQSFPGEKRQYGSSFVINNKAYVIGGIDGSYLHDFFCFDNGKWITLRQVAESNESYDDGYDIMRYKAVAFASQTKGYITLGANSASTPKDIWEYEPSTDVWSQKTSFESAYRTEGVAFTVKNRMFISTGYGGSSTAIYDDTWEFKPTERYSETD